MILPHNSRSRYEMRFAIGIIYIVRLLPFPNLQRAELQRTPIPWHSFRKPNLIAWRYKVDLSTHREDNHSSLPFLSQPWEPYQAHSIRSSRECLSSALRLKKMSAQPHFPDRSISSFHLRIAVLLLHRVRVCRYPEYVVASARAGVCISPQFSMVL